MPPYDSKLDVHMFSLYLASSVVELVREEADLPLVVDSLDDEAQCWTDGVHVLAHDLLDNCSLACIVETS